MRATLLLRAWGSLDWLQASATRCDACDGPSPSSAIGPIGPGPAAAAAPTTTVLLEQHGGQKQEQHQPISLSRGIAAPVTSLCDDIAESGISQSPGGGCTPEQRFCRSGEAVRGDWADAPAQEAEPHFSRSEALDECSEHEHDRRIRAVYELKVQAVPFFASGFVVVLLVA